MGAISNFQAQMKASKGFARTARYEVVLFPPESLKKSLLADGIDLDIYTRGLTMMCDSVTMPGKDLSTESVKHGQELERQQVSAHVFEGTITASFYLENNLAAKSFFELWQDHVVSNGSNNVNYYDDYVGTMEIFQLSSVPVTSTTITKDEDVSGGSQDHRTSSKKHGMKEKVSLQHKTIQTYGIKVNEVFPATVGQIEYAYASVNEIARIPIEFQYKSWKTIHPNDLTAHLS